MAELKQKKVIDVSEEATNLLESYLRAERELLTYIQNLDNYGEYCKCEEPQTVELIIADEGATPYCLICGGMEEI